MRAKAVQLENVEDDKRVVLDRWGSSEAPSTPTGAQQQEDSGAGISGVGDVGEESGQEEHGGGQSARAIPLPVPRAPSKSEWEKHIVSHMPYRSWCRHCVAGRGLERRHLSQSGVNEDAQPYISIDYCYLAGDATPILVAKDRLTGMIFAMAVERKGAADPHAVTKLTEWVDALGSVRVAIRSDGEPAIMQVAAAVRDARREGSITTLETSAPGDHAGNGIAERAVSQVTGLIRTLRAEVEYNTKATLKPESKTLAWIVNHAACLYNLDAVGLDGKVPFERWRGRKHTLQRCVFGNNVWYKPNPLSGRSKAEDRMVEGIFVGFRLKSGEYLVIADGEVRTARTIRRRTEEERWERPAALIDIPVLPWDRPGQPRASAVRPAGDRGRELDAERVDLPEPPSEGGCSKRVYLKQSDFAKHGLTESCPGCRAIRLGIRPQGHTAACRVRMETALGQTEAGKQRLDIAEKRTRDVIGDKAAKRLKLEFYRPGEAASSGGGGRSREEDNVEERAVKKARPEVAASASTGARCRDAEENVSHTVKKARVEDDDEDMGAIGLETSAGERGQSQGCASETPRWREGQPRRLVDLRSHVWNFDREKHREVAKQLIGASRPRLLRLGCDAADVPKLEFIWGACRTQECQQLGFVCEFGVGAYQSKFGRDLREGLGQEDVILEVRGQGKASKTMAMITNVEGIRMRAHRAMSRRGWVGRKELDRIIEDGIDDENEEMVADDAKRGSIPASLVAAAKQEERKYIEKMKVFEVVSREAARGKIIRTRWVSHEQGRCRDAERSREVGRAGVQKHGGARPWGALRADARPGSGQGSLEPRSRRDEPQREGGR